jgi:5-methylcytosine-specific restriction endonuclease McrA
MRLGAKRYFTGQPCVRGHLAPQATASRSCVECARLRLEVRRRRAGISPFRVADPDARAKWRAANLKQRVAYNREWQRRNPEKAAASAKKWRSENRGAVNARRSKRDAAKRKCIPKWVNAEAIRAIYCDAEQITRETGIPHHVDHIVPIQHHSVCGLHVAWNLRILTAAENVRKGNSFDASSPLNIALAA